MRCKRSSEIRVSYLQLRSLQSDPWLGQSTSISPQHCLRVLDYPEEQEKKPSQYTSRKFPKHSIPFHAHFHVAYRAWLSVRLYCSRAQENDGGPEEWLRCYFPTALLHVRGICILINHRSPAWVGFLFQLNFSKHDQRLYDPLCVPITMRSRRGNYIGFLIRKLLQEAEWRLNGILIRRSGVRVPALPSLWVLGQDP